MHCLTRFLARRDGLFAILASVLLVVIIGLLDYATGPELDFSIFYLLPIALAAWVGGTVPGVAIALFSTAFALVDDKLTAPPYGHDLIPYWNALADLGFYLLATSLLAKVHAARRLERALVEFLVHDLRSPLVTIGMALRILGREHSDTTDGHGRLIANARASASRAAAMVDSLLDVSRLEGSRMPLDFRPTDPLEIVQSAVEQVSFWAETEGLRIDVEAPAGLPAVLADGAAVGRVLANLLGNAIKHSPEGAAITVGVRPASEHTVRFDVTDRGPGVPPRWAGRVFERHAQVEARANGAAVGTGLGLTFCRLAVTAHGGRIWLQSRPGVETTFSFELPTAPRPA
jgi:signal transduction histidine kinase